MYAVLIDEYSVTYRDKSFPVKFSGTTYSAGIRMHVLNKGSRPGPPRCPSSACRSAVSLQASRSLAGPHDAEPAPQRVRGVRRQVEQRDAAQGSRRQGRQEVHAVESPGAAGPGRDGAPRHVGVRAVPRARHQAGDALHGTSDRRASCGKQGQLLEAGPAAGSRASCWKQGQLREAGPAAGSRASCGKQGQLLEAGPAAGSRASCWKQGQKGRRRK